MEIKETLNMNNISTLKASKKVVKDVKFFLNSIAIIFLNVIIFLRQFFPFYTFLLIGVAGILLFIALLDANKKKIPFYILPILLYTLIVILNYFIGGDRNYIITFTLSILIFVCLSLSKDCAIVQYKCFFWFSFLHLIFNIAVLILSQTLINTILLKLLGANYSSNYDWRVIQGTNPGMTTQPGDNAMYLMVFFAICFVNVFFGKKGKRKLYVIGLIVSYLCIISTGKRFACLFSIVAAIIVLFLVSNNKRRILQFIIVGCIFLAVIVLFTPLLDSLLGKSNGDISNGRFDLWIYALNKFTDNPILGIGLKSIYNSIGLDVHNTYIQILTETGIVGFCVFLRSIYLILKHSYSNIKGLIKVKNQKLESRNVLVGFYLLIFLLLYGLTGNTFIDYLPLMLIILSMYMANSAYEVI